GSPLVVTPHFDAGSGPRVYARAVARGTLVGADRVIALTEREGTALAALGVDRARIRVIPNGVDTEDFLPARVPRPASAPLTMLYVGRIDPDHKGLPDLVRGLAEMKERESVTLRIVGEDWGGGSALRRLARGLR
ncbi:glycosyl transferase, group 1, partial [mine drainage metagenome]